MDIYPRYPKRIALNAIAAAFPIPVDNLRLSVCLTIGGEAASNVWIQYLQAVVDGPCCGVVLIGLALILGPSNRNTVIGRT